ncbi:hypothetical protein [Hymenobacter persicinus]|uniref:RES domain-containing protein n=1 Tax=Hymenobacter persicinus TaxID=2025506 RepID=A0A4Q5LIE2_9BACT|nr:hypothetical protein [Hymenobacter persicinus]RYU84756.1 hypothetical protein EWM57_00060 [Hymenobacter persicinus]
MPDLTGFLSDSFQYQLKATAALNSGNRFENALKHYFAAFFDEFRRLDSAHTVDSFQDAVSDTKPRLYDWIDCVREGLQGEINEYENLFNDISYAYQLFVRGKHYHATLHLFDVLEKYDMADVIEPGELGLYYKGRTKRPGDVVTDDDYYYHISFEKRFLIANQRFSYSGQPILYIGSSVLDVLYELRCDLSDYQKIALAAIGYDPLIETSISEKTGKRFPPLKVYDVTNHIHKTITQTLHRLMQAGVGVPACDDEGFRPNLKHLKKDFKKFILTQLCTFKRTHNHTFIEEYIPAQILTEALRINGYHGIKFPSTQFDGKLLDGHAQQNLSAIQENLALFTTYSGEEQYDYELMNYFIVQPLDEATAFAKSVAEHQEDIKAIQGDITTGVYHSGKLARPIEHASMNVGKVRGCEFDLDVEGKPYFDWDFARMELYAQASYLNQLKSQLMYFSNGEQNMFPMK